MTLETVKALPEAAAKGELAGRSTAEAAPKVRAATASAMTPDAITAFVRLNPSDFIRSSFSYRGCESTDGSQKIALLPPVADLTCVLGSWLGHGGNPWPSLPTELSLRRG